MIKPWLWLPPKLAHDLAPLGLEVMAALAPTRDFTWRPREWRGLQFRNPLGIAGGVDKNADSLKAWQKLGAGFIEVGTVTPRPQSINPGPVMARNLEQQALWNRMGFPGEGLWSVRENLHEFFLEHSDARAADQNAIAGRAAPRAFARVPVLVNIGKNRDTANDIASRDYVECITHLAGLADAFVINVSSPNTVGLRELLQPEALLRLLGPCIAARNKSAAPSTPLLLKLSPDIEDLRLVVATAESLGIDGYITTNTTLHREPRSPFPREGGVSGRPLAERSKKSLRDLLTLVRSHASGADKLVISVGGVLTVDDVRERLEMGADLVQVYTAMAFSGPRFFADVARQLRP